MVKRVKLSNNGKRKLAQLLSGASHALQQGDLDGCLHACDQIEQLWPTHPDQLHLRGLVAMATGELEQAELFLRQATEAAPARADVLASLGNVLLHRSDTDAALICYRRALQLDGHDIASHLGLAAAMMVLEQHEQAIELLEQARKRKPGDTAIRMGLFQACHAANRYADARRHLEAIVAREPDHSEARYGLAVLALESGELADADRHIRLAIRLNPFYADAWLVLADLRTIEAADEGDVQLMRQVYQQCPADSDARMKMAFALAKVMDDLADYDAAFALLQEAHAIRRSQCMFDVEAEVAALAAVQTVMTQALVNDCVVDDHPACLFVIGMPRSGTTLVEQVLAMHPAVTALGENGHFEAAVRDVLGCTRLPSPAQLSVLSADQCAAIGARYLARIEHMHGRQACYCDKTLSHVALVGLIHRALPHARFVHVHRHPLDTALSIYKNNLQGAYFGYAHDLAELACYFAASQALLTHWRKILPAGLFCELEYEQLVRSQEEQTRTLLASCGLEWSEECLHFQRASHAVQTASAVQVRKPLSSRSIGGWRHYRRHLMSLQALAPEDLMAG
ncbi:tetratricopeptide repeat protein [Mariprofundus erugo]|uniref:Tetratricopeptide repeat protein n=1 Tax=Mariprofundus erugo TaxID=2528639 RepID=A0A5R9GVH0_9PROT|nr:sulfotransferase [Mariprofundus erugo]TLS68945.1 tetratricopeptide repeat protein [Mariprofundus erugo]